MFARFPLMCKSTGQYQLKVGKGVFQQLKAASEAETTDKPLLTGLVSMALSA